MAPRSRAGGAGCDIPMEKLKRSFATRRPCSTVVIEGNGSVSQILLDLFPSTLFLMLCKFVRILMQRESSPISHQRQID